MNDQERAAALLDGIKEKVGRIQQRVDGGRQEPGSLEALCERLQQAHGLLEGIQETPAAATAGMRSDDPQQATDWKTLLIAGAIVAAFMMFVAAADGTGASGDILFVALLETAVFGGAGWLAGVKAMQRLALLPAVIAGFVAWVVVAGLLSAVGMGASSAPFAAMFGAAAWYSARSRVPPWA